MPRYRAFFIPGPEKGVQTDDAVQLGIEWLLQQEGTPLILLHALSMTKNNAGLLDALIVRYGIDVSTPNKVRGAGWPGGAILAPWATDIVLASIDSALEYKATAVCVIGWARDEHVAWLAARDAVDLTENQRAADLDDLVDDPVVKVALDHASKFVNHGKALLQPEDKAFVVRTLQELVRGGHRFKVEGLAAYAMATGWAPDEVRRLREYGKKALDGTGIQLKAPDGPGSGSCLRWEEEARAGK